MMYDFVQLGVSTASILLPKPPNSLGKWAVIACDQFTSESAYWQQVEDKVLDAPSTLNIIYPECFLHQGNQRIGTIHATMADYKRHVLGRACTGFVLVERQTTFGNRLGLLMTIDLEQYDFAPGSKSLIRPTEQTIEERIPPRVKIRAGAPLETSHVMLLADDPQKTLIEPLYGIRDTLPKLYDFELMLKGGRVRGWVVSGEALKGAQEALSGLYEQCNGLLFAVGDGNHSLAAARQCWLDMKPKLTEEQRLSHPARYALVEVVNLHDSSIRFEPIHRAVFGADCAGLSHDFVMWCRRTGMSVIAANEEQAQMYLLDSPVTIENSTNPLPVAVLQPFLDQWIAGHAGTSIDYIHGQDSLNALSEQGACCIRLKSIDKNTLFEVVRVGGPLPRKTFSMGEARDKRYYLECRSLTV